MRRIGTTISPEPASEYVSTTVRIQTKSRTFVTIPSYLLKHCLAVHVIMSEHAILELVNSVRILLYTFLKFWTHSHTA